MGERDQATIFLSASYDDMQGPTARCFTVPKRRSSLPLRFRLLNMVGKSLRAMSVPVAQFDEETVRTVAVKETGLTDFGDPHFREGLLRLLESAETDADLHFIGRLTVREVIANALASRLLLMEARKRTPEIFERPLIPPIIVLGLPRSGTTFLHRMLAADPAHRAIPLWELLRPLPNGGSSVGATPDRRHQIAEQRLGLRLRLAPDLDRKHYVRAHTPEECMWLLATTFVSPVFWAVAPVYGYLDWYKGQDRLKAYKEYRWLLQVLQAIHPRCRLALKAPAHTGALSALLKTIPDALLVQTHRHPVEACNSLNSLFYSVHAMVTKRVDAHRMAEANVSLQEHEIALNLAARDAHPGAVLDVHYDRLIADPVGTVRSIYDHFGLVWSDTFEERLGSYVRQNPKGRHGPHRYASGDFGLTDGAIAERFAAYSERFGLTD